MQTLDELKQAFKDLLKDINVNDVYFNEKEMNEIFNFVDTKINTKEEYSILYHIYILSENSGYYDGYENGRCDVLMN